MGSPLLYADHTFAPCRIDSMADSERDELAERIEELRTDFELALSNRRKYPLVEFQAFVRSVRQYLKLTGDHPMIHRTVASSVNGLREFLQAEWKRVPGDVLFEADRLECQLFAGYDPSSGGDEPPGL
jgi:hypothetical protein